MRLKSVPPKRQFHGIDWIRALASVAVVALHYHAIPSGLTSGPDADAVWQIVNGYLLRLAVPLFHGFAFLALERSGRPRRFQKKLSTARVVCACLANAFLR
jgi:surface polysaccharide O-acyltransferase-like enzyme